MADYYNVTTNLGDVEVANAITNGTKINITHVAFGDGNGSVPTPNKARTTLVREVHRQAVTKYERHPTNPNWIIIETIIPSEVGGFTIREMGIIGNEKLLSHGSHAPYEKVAGPSGTSEYRLKFTQNITDGNVVSITLDDSLIYATQAWTDENYVPRDEIVDDLTTNDAKKPVSAKQAKKLQDEKVAFNDVVNNLTSNSESKPLAANQGMVLDNKIKSIEDIILYAPIAWPSTVIPDGFMAMMGQSILAATHPKLYALYGDALPDMRAYSIRGLDYGRGIDIGRSIRSSQLDENRYHEHGVVKGTGGYAGVVFTTDAPGQNILNSIQFKLNGSLHPVNDPSGRMSDLIMDASGGSETRVKTVAYLYIVKQG